MLHHAKALRQNMTHAESRLWYVLRAHRFQGWKFRRQQPLGPYIVDFVSLRARLVVEVDGGQHLESAADRQRDAWLRQRGFEVLRFWNDQVLMETESVLQVILTALNERPLSPGPSPARGEGNDE